MENSHLISMTASQVVAALKCGDINPLDLIDVAESRFNAVDKHINAMPIPCFDWARQAARRLAERKSCLKKPASWLAGLPIGVKDLSHVAGVRTTMGGSPIFEDFVADYSSLDVENLLANGAIPVGKLASPEFGHNATTYSQLFGFTRNPWNTALTTAGSSGGSAAAVAAGEVWMATGSDLGASIRTPASFCGIVGLRPSPGLVPRGPVPYSFNHLPVHGPMARDVADTALMLDAMVGFQPGDPLSFEPPTGCYQTAAASPRMPTRIAVSTDLGVTHCDSEIAELTLKAAKRLEDIGCVVEETHPNLSGAVESFYTLRGTGHIAGFADLVAEHSDMLSEEVKWSVDTAREYCATDIAMAERERSRIQANTHAFFKEYDLLICPANVVPPFPVDWTTVKEHEGHRFERYIDWIAITFVITLTACPSLSVPCGFLRSGMPLGVQLVGPPRGEYKLFEYGAMFENIMGLGQLTPIIPRVAKDA